MAQRTENIGSYKTHLRILSNHVKDTIWPNKDKAHEMEICNDIQSLVKFKWLKQALQDTRNDWILKEHEFHPMMETYKEAQNHVKKISLKYLHISMFSSGQYSVQ